MASETVDFASIEPLAYVIYILSGLYGLLVLIPAVQLIRYYKRAPDAGWNTQKVFFVMTMITNLIRTAFFLLIPYWAPEDFFMSNFHHILFTILDDLPGMLYFTTYTLLILFWAEIIHMANTQSTSSSKYRKTFAIVNGFVYLCQFFIWVLLVVVPNSVEDINYADHAFFGVISLLAALAFCIYGGKLYNMLSNFPIDTKNRRNRLKEVFVSTIVCTTCFTIRATYIGLSILQEGMDLNFLFVGSFYILVEIIPCAIILWILRKLPPAKRGRSSRSSRQDKDAMFQSNESEPTSSLLGKPAGANDDEY